MEVRFLRDQIRELNLRTHRIHDHDAWQDKQLLLNAERDEDFAKIAKKHTEMIHGLQSLGQQQRQAIDDMIEAHAEKVYDPQGI